MVDAIVMQAELGKTDIQTVLWAESVGKKSS